MAFCSLITSKRIRQVVLLLSIGALCLFTPRNAYADDSLYTFSSTENARPIKDLGSIEQSIHLQTPDQTIKSAIVSIELSHEYLGDLKMSIRTPQAKTIPLPIPENYKSGETYYLEYSLDAATLDSSEGNWTLIIQDTAQLDQGTLLRWKLDLTLTTAPITRTLNSNILLKTQLKLIKKFFSSSPNKQKRTVKSLLSSIQHTKTSINTDTLNKIQLKNWAIILHVETALKKGTKYTRNSALAVKVRRLLKKA